MPDSADHQADIAQFSVLYPFELDQFQLDAIQTFLDGDSVMVAAPTGTGKALGARTPVLTPNGWVAIRDLRPGDRVIGANGSPVNVLGVYHQGVRPAHRVTFTDGASVVCDAQHLWSVNTRSRRYAGLPWRILTLEQILAEGLTDGGGYRHFIPMVEPVVFEPLDPIPEEELSLVAARSRTGLTQRALAGRAGASQGAISAWESGRRPIGAEYQERLHTALDAAGPRPSLDPYLLGLLLGTGSFVTPTLSFSAADAQLIESVRALLPADTELIHGESRPYDWLIVSRARRTRNSVLAELSDQGLRGARSEAKFIPKRYLFGTVTERIALLQGLLDTDASMDPRGYLEYTTVSARLADDVVFVVRSLGGRARITTKATGYQIAYRIGIKLPPEIQPFRLERKLQRYRQRRHIGPTRAIASVELAGSAEMVCIKVDAPDGLFVVDGFVVTHNTVVAEFGVYESFRRGGKVMYTTPIKALSNQKFRDLRELYGDNVGLLTGDVTENPQASIVVMTTEVLRNMLLQTPWELDAVDCIIFDEVHYIADPERGTTWEEAIILCPEHIQLICLSATVSNAQEIADWIGRTHRPIRLITHFERAVPLALYYYIDRKLHLVIDHAGNQVADFPHTGGEVRRRAANTALSPEARRQLEEREPQAWEIIQTLNAENMLPAIYFLFSRRDCEDFAQHFAVMRPNLVRDEAVSERIEQVIQSYLAGLRVEDQELGQVQSIITLARQGIGFHHAGLLPILKQLVEVLFSRGLMQVVFATDTLALGVNMPARTVVIGRMTKWDGRRRRLLIPNEFQQMAGRAGRRGMDAAGSIVVPHSPWITFRETLQVATGELEPVRSSFSIRYNTVLNLWDPPHGSRVRQMLQQSLAQFQSARKIRDLEDAVLGVGREIEGIPQGCLIGLDGGDELLDDYRRLNSSINTLRGRERRLHRDIDELRISLDARPWPEPGRQALRSAFRALAPGTPVHLRRGGWAVYLGRGTQGGVGLFLVDDTIELISEYRQIDYLPAPGHPIALPEQLLGLTGSVADAASLLTEDERAALEAELTARDLPDLDAMMSQHRRVLERRLGDERAVLDRQLADVREQARAMNQARTQHPCHACPRRKEHQNNLRAVMDLERERGRLETELGRELTGEEERVRRIIRGIRDVLHRFGYLHRGYPTAKADTLANVFDTNGLILCEMVDRGFFDKLAPAAVAEVFSWFAYDRDFRFGNSFTLTNRLVLLRRRLDDLEQEVFAAERNSGLFISTGHSEGFYGAMRAWCHGASMSRVLEQIELSEGDMVLTFNKTLDLMRQVRDMLAQAMPDHPLRTTLAQAEALIRRDIVEQSLSIGFMPVIVDAGAETSDPDLIDSTVGDS